VHIHQRIEKSYSFLPELHQVGATNSWWRRELGAFHPPVHISDAILEIGSDAAGASIEHSRVGTVGSDRGLQCPRALLQ